MLSWGGKIFLKTSTVKVDNFNSFFFQKISRNYTLVISVFSLVQSVKPSENLIYQWSLSSLFIES